jgi:hypothetical protein
MASEFIIKTDGKLETYTEFDSIPDKFDYIIKFAPEVPEPPHSDEQHEEMKSWNIKLQELIKRENSYASSNSNR